MEKKTQFIEKLSPGDAVDDIFMLAEKSVSRKKNGDNYLNLTLSDKTGDIRGVAWDDVDRLSAAAASGDFVRVTGGVSDYRGRAQMTIKGLVKCDRESVDPGDFLPVTRRNPDQMFNRLKKTIDAHIKDEYLKRLLDLFWTDEEFVRRFKTAPGAKKMHHAYLGGLLEHTLSMTVLVEKIARHYSGINMDILLAGAVLHDIGKIREFEYDYRIDYTDEGKLLTHIVIGCGMVEEKIRQIEGFPDETAFLLRHMLVSHHGCREFGSPEPPKTIEAVLLNHIDDIDAKMNGLRDFIEKEAPDEAWTSRNFMLGRHLYKGKTGS